MTAYALAMLAIRTEQRKEIAAAGARRIQTEFSYEMFRDKHRKLFRQWGVAAEV